MGRQSNEEIAKDAVIEAVEDIVKQTVGHLFTYQSNYDWWRSKFEIATTDSLQNIINSIAEDIKSRL